jgi:hypothetical protein
VCVYDKKPLREMSMRWFSDSRDIVEGEKLDFV